MKGECPACQQDVPLFQFKKGETRSVYDKKIKRVCQKTGIFVKRIKNFKHLLWRLL